MLKKPRWTDGELNALLKAIDDGRTSLEELNEAVGGARSFTQIYSKLIKMTARGKTHSND